MPFLLAMSSSCKYTCSTLSVILHVLISQVVRCRDQNFITCMFINLFFLFSQLRCLWFKNRRRKFQFLAFFVVQVVFHQIVCIIFFLAFVYFDIFLILISACVVVGKGVGLGFFFSTCISNTEWMMLKVFNSTVIDRFNTLPYIVCLN